MFMGTGSSKNSWAPRLGVLMLVVVPLGVATTVSLITVDSAYAENEEGQPNEDSLQESRLQWFLKALGASYSIAFLGLSFCFVSLAVMNLLTTRRSAIVPMELAGAFEHQLKEKHYQEAFELVKGDESFLAKVLAAGLVKLSGGFEKAQAAMQEVGHEESMKLEHRMSYVALIGTVSPMVGLLGTVDGMIASFQVIAISKSTPRPADLAKGISTALVTTLVGLWLAIPAVALYGYLRNRVARMVFEAGALSGNLMSRFETVGRKS